MLQISFILKIFVYLAVFNIFYENNDETFVKLETVNLRCLKFECSVTSDNWSILLVNFLQLFDCVGKKKKMSRRRFFSRDFTLLILKYSDYIFYIILKFFIRQSSFGDDSKYLYRLETSKE